MDSSTICKRYSNEMNTREEPSFTSQTCWSSMSVNPDLVKFWFLRIYSPDIIQEVKLFQSLHKSLFFTSNLEELPFFSRPPTYDGEPHLPVSTYSFDLFRLEELCGVAFSGLKQISRCWKCLRINSRIKSRKLRTGVLFNNWDQDRYLQIGHTKVRI